MNPTKIRNETDWAYFTNKAHLNLVCLWLKSARLKSEDLDRLAELVAKKQKEAKE